MASERIAAFPWRTAGLVAVLVAGFVGFFLVINHHEPVRTWLILPYLGNGLLAIGWALSCFSLGLRLMKPLSQGLCRRDVWTFAFGLGVLCFSLAVFFVGTLGLLSSWTFVLLPLVFLASGAKPLWSEGRRVWSKISKLRHFPRRRWHAPVLFAGVLAVVLLYVAGMNPTVSSFDSRWYHLPTAQRYALRGAIAPFEEGLWTASYPQLATYLFTWAFLLPFAGLFDKLVLCFHLEVVLFVATLAQIPVAVRHLVPKARVELSWVALFLFPGVFLYDSNLHTGADHIAAFWAIPIALSCYYCFKRFTFKTAIIAAAMLSGAALTKYTAILVIAGPVAFLLLWICWLLIRKVGKRRREVLVAALVGMSLLILLTGTHWFKNWMWYGDPAYPLLNKWFKPHPWNEEAAQGLAILAKVAHPATFDSAGLLEAFKVMFTFSFIHHDWRNFHGAVPVFGSLFTLLLATVPFVRKKGRIVVLSLMTMGGIFVWYLLNHYDRFLQTLVPWMAAVTAALLILLWRQGNLVRVAVSALVGLQMLWGADVPFLPTHNILGQSPLAVSLAQASSTYRKDTLRLAGFGDLYHIGRRLPPDARVLPHEFIMTLGLDRDWVTDVHQSKISYGRLRTPHAIWRSLSELGVTHVVWNQATIVRDSLAGDLAFHYFAQRQLADAPPGSSFQVGAQTVVPLTEPRPFQGPISVGVFRCVSPYKKGRYHLSQLTLPVVDPGPPPEPLGPLRKNRSGYEEDMLVVHPGCHRDASATKGYRLVAQRGPLQLFLSEETLQRGNVGQKELPRRK